MCKLLLARTSRYTNSQPKIRDMCQSCDEQACDEQEDNLALPLFAFMISLVALVISIVHFLLVVSG
jgi:hypothetical protein